MKIKNADLSATGRKEEKTIEQETREHFNYIRHFVKKGKEDTIWIGLFIFG